MTSPQTEQMEGEPVAVSKGPKPGQALVKLPPLDVSLLHDAFVQAGFTISDQHILGWLSSGAVAPNLSKIYKNTFDPSSSGFLALFEEGGVPRKQHVESVEKGIAYLATCIYQKTIEPKQITASKPDAVQLAEVASAIRVDSLDSGFFTQFPAPGADEHAMLICVRAALTCALDLHISRATDSVGFMTDLLSGTFGRPMRANAREKWTPYLILPNPNTDAKNLLSQQSLASETLPTTVLPGLWTAAEIQTLQAELKRALKRSELAACDWADLALLMPGRSKNDCITYFNAHKRDFGLANAVDVPCEEGRTQLHAPRCAAERTNDKTSSSELQNQVGILAKELEASQLHVEQLQQECKELTNLNRMMESQLVMPLRYENRIELLQSRLANTRAQRDERDIEIEELQRDTHELKNKILLSEQETDAAYEDMNTAIDEKDMQLEALKESALRQAEENSAQEEVTNQAYQELDCKYQTLCDEHDDCETTMGLKNDEIEDLRGELASLVRAEEVNANNKRQRIQG